VGTGRSIKTVAAMQTFGVDAENTTNGVSGGYSITWYSEIAAEDGDVLAIPFPAETAFGVNKNEIVKGCSFEVPKDAVFKVECKYVGPIQDKKLLRGAEETWEYGPAHLTSDGSYEATYEVLEMKLTDIAGSTGLYKVRVEPVTNPASRRGSSPFGRVTHQTKDGKEIQEYKVIVKEGITDPLVDEDFEVPPVAIETEYGSILKVTSDDITQHSEKYGLENVWYELRYRPYSVVRAVNGNDAKLKVTVSYPKQVVPNTNDE